jgi:predicted nucleic acid-binding protein
MGVKRKNGYMILADTNIFIEYYRNNPAICEILEQIDPQDIAVNDVVCAELYFGARNRQELADLVTDMEKLTVLAISVKISRLAVDLVRQYCLSHKLKLPDAQIAATAIFHNAELFTLNRRDFAYIPNLKMYDHK